MPYRWPDDTDFATWELDVLDRHCSVCGRGCTSVITGIATSTPSKARSNDLQAQSLSRSRVPGVPRPRAPGSKPRRAASLGHRLGRLLLDRPSTVLSALRHPQIRAELLDAYRILLSDDAIGQYIHRYQVMLAARKRPAALLRQYHWVDEIILSIDGLQPEKGHETLYVVRELTRNGPGSPRR